MKEATGELNMTVVTVVAIAAVAAFFYALIWPSIKANLLAQTHCSSAVQCTNCNEKKCTCKYYEDDGNGGQKLADTPIECDVDSSHGISGASSSSSSSSSK